MTVAGICPRVEAAHLGFLLHSNSTKMNTLKRKVSCKYAAFLVSLAALHNPLPIVFKSWCIKVFISSNS